MVYFYKYYRIVALMYYFLWWNLVMYTFWKYGLVIFSQQILRYIYFENVFVFWNGKWISLVCKIRFQILSLHLRTTKLRMHWCKKLFFFHFFIHFLVHFFVVTVHLRFKYICMYSIFGYQCVIRKNAEYKWIESFYL